MAVAVGLEVAIVDRIRDLPGGPRKQAGLRPPNTMIRLTKRDAGKRADVPIPRASRDVASRSDNHVLVAHVHEIAASEVDETEGGEMTTDSGLRAVQELKAAFGASGHVLAVPVNIPHVLELTVPDDVAHAARVMPQAQPHDLAANVIGSRGPSGTTSIKLAVLHSATAAMDSAQIIDMLHQEFDPVRAREAAAQPAGRRLCWVVLVTDFPTQARVSKQAKRLGVTSRTAVGTSVICFDAITGALVSDCTWRVTTD
jgi:hypothetical protein